MYAYRATYFLLLTLVLAFAPNRSATAFQVVPTLDPEKRISQYGLQTWSEDDGLPQSTISAIAETSDGYLWLGTQEGLARYNGITFDVFNKGNTPAFGKDHKIVSLLVDTSDRLWIGLDAGLVRFENGRFVNVGDQIGRGLRVVNSIIEDETGTIWVGSAKEGLFSIQPGSNTLEKSDYAIADDDKISSLVADMDGSLWIGTNNGLIHQRNKLVRRYSEKDGLPSVKIEALFRDQQGIVWVATESGIVTLSHELIKEPTYRPLRSMKAQVFFEDRVGTLWIGTSDQGLARITSSGVEIFSKKGDSTGGLTYQSISSIYEDDEGSLWLGTDGGGLNRLYEGAFTSYTTMEGLSENMIWSVFEDSHGGMWFGTESGGVDHLVNDRVETFSTDTGLSHNQVSGLAETADGTIWIGTYGGGLNAIRNGTIRHFTTDDGMADNRISGTYTDSQDRLWIATDGGISIYDHGTFTNLTSKDGLASDYISVIYEGSDSDMWVGTYKSGLNRITKSGIETYTAADGLGSDNVTALYVDEEKTVWIGTYGGGLTRLKDDTFTTYSMTDGLFNDYIYLILEDDDGALWMTCNKGIFKVSKNALNTFKPGSTERITSRVYTKQDGLKEVEMNGGFQPAGWKGADGRLWFPSIGGVPMINPTDPHSNLTPPPVHVERFVVDGVNMDPNQSLSLEDGADKIEFFFAALSFQAPKQNRYQYKLVGYNEDWTLTSDHSATYTNLDPGNYQFVVIGSNNDDVWNEQGASVSFYLRPSFYETWWFISLSVLSLILLAGATYRIRISQLRKRHEELERERDKARAANEFKSVILDNLSHEFRTPLTGILGYSDILMSEAEGEEREFAGYIKANGNRLLHTLDSLLELARVQRMDLELKPEPVLVSDLIHEIIALQNEQRKNVDVALEAAIHSSPGEMNLDRRSIAYAIRALVDNALKFTDRGKVVVHLEASESETVIRVADTGIGISRSDFTRVFEPFKQASEGLDRSHEGAGVGLTVARHLIESMKGRLELESSGVDGSTFIITLPIHKENSDGGSAGSVHSRHRPHGDRFSLHRRNSDRVSSIDHASDLIG